MTMMVEASVGGDYPYPALLSAPVTLTLALSRRVGEGLRPIPCSSGSPRSRDDGVLDHCDVVEFDDVSVLDYGRCAVHVSDVFGWVAAEGC